MSDLVLSPANECLVDFEPIGCRVYCPAGVTILDAARAAGLSLVAVCGGEGTCGQCVVRIVTGAVSEVTATERSTLALEQIAENYRLACQAIVQGDLKIEVPLASRTIAQRLELMGEGAQVAFDPIVHEHLVILPPPTVHAPDSDLTLLRQVAGGGAEWADVSVLQRLPLLLGENNRTVRISRRGPEILDVRPLGCRPLGLAVDIGTTKVAAYLVDMETGAMLAADGITNPQVAYGEDVMSRITFAIKGGGQRLTDVLIDGLNDLVKRLCPEPERIVDAVVVGNTAMHHLFLGLPVRQLGLAPYAAVVSDPVDVKARDVGVQIGRGAYVHLLPNVAGFIGADHVSMVLAAGLDRSKGVYLGLDIGTNTEVALSRAGQLLSCSTASGPALEGAHIKHGLRAVDGAIEKVSLENGRLQVKTIGDAPAIGLCGSGVLDAVDQLRRNGLLTRRGRLLPGDYTREENGAREFVLVPAEQSGTCRDITLNEHDISEILLAKAAIRTGIDALFKQAGVGVDDLDGIVLAGAFGTHIDVQAAVGIGLLPGIPRERIQQVGNAAGVGARLALTSAWHRQQAVAIAKRIQYLELMVQPNFATHFAHAMFLPEV